MKYLLSIIKTYKEPLLILGVVFILFFTNYEKGATLSGWDNLQTELNPLLGLKRALFSVWQEYQSFGLTAGMGHAADLVRTIFLFLLSFILPSEIIRYVFHMTMVASGSLGAYVLFKEVKLQKILALFGALFYIFHFAAIQMLFLPYESFSLFLGGLPFEIWAFIKLIQNPLSKKTLLLFVGINFLFTGHSLSQQLFVVYVLILLSIGIGFLIHNANKNALIPLLKRGLLAAILLVIVNSFWLFPQIYFLKENGSIVKQAKINQLATEDVFYSNKEKGTLQSFLTFENFFYEREDQNKVPLFASWKYHRQGFFASFVIWTFALLILLGLFQKSPYRVHFLFGYVICAIMLLSNTFFFEQINTLFRNNAFINQIFRSPFTKFAIPYALISSYFLVLGITFVKEHTIRFFLLPQIKPQVKNLLFLTHKLYSNLYSTNSDLHIAYDTRMRDFASNTFAKSSMRDILIIALFSSLFFYALPAFLGYYFSPSMKVTIPSEYARIQSFFSSVSKDKRIALLPEYTFWGWFYHKWGYNGSGFIWYGIEQPIVSRTFDVWSKNSENYFWEAKKALEEENLPLFESVLEKYAVDYLILDTSLTPVVSTTKAIQYDRLIPLLSKSKKIKPVTHEGFLTVYEFKNPTVNRFVRIGENIPSVGPTTSSIVYDAGFQNKGIYKSSTKPDIYLPFLDFTSQTNTKKHWELLEGSTNWIVQTALPFNPKDYALSQKSGSMTFSLYSQNTPVTYSMPYTIELKGKLLQISFPKVKVSSFIPSKTMIENCTQKGSNELQGYDNQLTVTSYNGANGCFSYQDTFLDQNYGYIVRIQNKNTKGQRFSFYVSDKTKEQPYIEDRLKDDFAYYLIGSKFSHGQGYSFHFQNTSYKNITAENTLLDLSLFLMPYSLFESIYLEKIHALSTPTRFVSDFQTEKINYYTYQVTPKTVVPNSSIILYQSFDHGWHAYQLPKTNSSLQKTVNIVAPFFMGKEIKSHTLINNWANGWDLPTSYNPNTHTIILFFWPQYLESFGLFLIAVTVGAIILTKADLFSQFDTSL